jgi:hypothetical protein
MHGAKEEVPGALRERLEADRQLGEDVGDIDPAAVPANAPIGRDPPDLEVLRIGDRGEAPRGGSV